MVHYGPLAAADFSHKLPAETMMIKANGSSAYHQDNREASPLDEPPLNFMRNGAALLVAASDLVDQQQQQLAQLTRTRNQFYCDQCNMVFGSKSAHTSHMKSHAKYAAAQQAAAASASAPVAGQDVVVGSSTPPVGSAPAAGGDPYQCDKCNKTFAVPARLVRHYRTHTGERPFECEFCHKMFSVKENLQVHRRIHTKERPYKCDVCGRAFEHSGKLHRHMRIHTGERPHKCSICNKTFIQSGQLVIHMRTHTGEKPYKCPVDGCGKGFTCSKQLKVHSRTHTGEKPYHCDICFRDFGYNHVLKLHRVQHYGSKCYKCTICDETFKNKKEMEAHIKGHANEMPDDEAGAAPQAQSPSPDVLESGSSNSQGALKYESEGHHHKYRKLYDSRMVMLESPSSSSALQTETPRETSSEATNSDNESDYYNSYSRFDYGSQSGVALLAAASLAAASSAGTSVEAATAGGRAANHATAFLYEPLNIMRPNGLLGSVQGTHNNDSTNFRSSNELVKRVEAALAGAEPLLTPPRSSPESPDRSSSPESSESGVLLVRDIMSLPIRKRKLYLKDDMANVEAEARVGEAEPATTQRQSSVIQFAKSS